MWKDWTKHKATSKSRDSLSFVDARIDSDPAAAQHPNITKKHFC